MKTLEIKDERVPVKQSSRQFTWNWRDAAKGAVVAVLAAVLPIVMETIEAGAFIFDWKHIAGVGCSAFIAYMLKNFFSPSEVIISKKDLPS